MKAIPFMKLVRQYATVHGLPFFTWKDQSAAISNYKEKYLALKYGAA
jgi:hypothetical protein